MADEQTDEDTFDYYDDTTVTETDTDDIAVAGEDYAPLEFGEDFARAEYEDEEEGDEELPGEDRRTKRKKRSWMERCLDQKWKCDGPLWRLYMNA